MTASTVEDLVHAARVAAPGHADLIRCVQTAAGAIGVDVVDLRGPGVDGVWELRFRIDAAPGRARAAPVDAAPASAVLPAAPFVSPVPDSMPFTGDGTDDIVRFAAEADTSVSIPARGLAGDARFPVPLSEAQRAGKLPGVIAGDVLLRVVHEGRSHDSGAVAAALEEGEGAYLSELRRVNVEASPGAYDTAAQAAKTALAEVQ